MLDSQKLSFNDWLLGYKHGVYVFTSDACSVCQDYKKEIEYINHCYLYFVEVTTEEQKSVLLKITRRSALPMTCYYKDNHLDFVRLGQQFENTGIKEMMQYLKQFGDKPLPPEEIKKRIEETKNPVKLSFYIFTQTTLPEEKEKVMQKCHEFHELPIDIDTICPSLDRENRLKLFRSNYPFAKIVIFKDGRSNALSSFGQAMMLEYSNMSLNSKANANFEIRQVSEIVGK